MPIALDSPIDDLRPDRPADIIAAGDNGHRETTIAVEPVRGLRHQRAEGRGCPEPDQDMHRNELPQRGRKSGENVSQPKEADAERHRHHDAEPIGDLAGGDAAETEADHGQGKGQRYRAPGRAEFGLHHRQHHNHRPHPDAADRADQDGQRKPHPRLA
jgi:hypothetical protein